MADPFSIGIWDDQGQKPWDPPMGRHHLPWKYTDSQDDNSHSGEWKESYSSDPATSTFTTTDEWVEFEGGDPLGFGDAADDANFGYFLPGPNNSMVWHFTPRPWISPRTRSPVSMASIAPVPSTPAPKLLAAVLDDAVSSERTAELSSPTDALSAYVTSDGILDDLDPGEGSQLAPSANAPGWRQTAQALTSVLMHLPSFVHYVTINPEIGGEIGKLSVAWSPSLDADRNGHVYLEPFALSFGKVGDQPAGVFGTMSIQGGTLHEPSVGGVAAPPTAADIERFLNGDKSKGPIGRLITGRAVDIGDAGGGAVVDVSFDPWSVPEFAGEYGGGVQGSIGEAGVEVEPIDGGVFVRIDLGSFELW